MKGIVIYKGKYGATAQYAEWIAEALYLPLYDLDKQFIDQLETRDTIIIGSPVYVGKLLVKNWLFKNARLLKNKKILLFIVCGAAGDKIKQEQVIKQNLPGWLAKSGEIYFLPGKVDMKKLSWWDRFLIRMAAMMQKDPTKRQAMRRGYDAVKREHINDLIKNVLHYANTEKVI
ncbi:MAG: flavodoxin domain-containing protein [Bacteroidetes bacterium]|nr:flavodoxin domain-containing protein [Bacteroidota bacterium]